MTEHETNLRDLAAMFALTGLLIHNKEIGIASIPIAFALADEFMNERKEHNERDQRPT